MHGIWNMRRFTVKNMELRSGYIERPVSLQVRRLEECTAVKSCGTFEPLQMQECSLAYYSFGDENDLIVDTE